MEPPQKKLRLDGVTVARTDDSSECSLPSPLRDSEDPDSDDDSGNSLPPEIDSDDEDDMNIRDVWFEGTDTLKLQVPQSLPESHVDVVELFSPPRVVPACAALGLAAGISVDIQNDGTDLSDPEHQHRIMSYIQRAKPKVTIISPPCTFYSQLNVLWNRKKRTPEENARAKLHADSMLHFGMRVGEAQVAFKRGFCHEHPLHATSWEDDMVRSLMDDPQMGQAVFHMCRFGMVCPDTKMPLRKATKLMTNMLSVMTAFHNKKCVCNAAHWDPKANKHVKHRRVEGKTSTGVQLSRHAQIYPDAMVNVLASSVKRYIDMHHFEELD